MRLLFAWLGTTHWDISRHSNAFPSTRFDDAFDRPWAGRAILAAASFVSLNAMSETVNVIEFYNAAQDHYFISSLQPDINALDSGQFPG